MLRQHLVDWSAVYSSQYIFGIHLVLCFWTFLRISGREKVVYAWRGIFTFMHLADAFIQSDLHCIQVTVYQLLLSLGLKPMILALLAPCSTIWATGKLCSSHYFYATLSKAFEVPWVSRFSFYVWLIILSRYCLFVWLVVLCFFKKFE